MDLGTVLVTGGAGYIGSACTKSLCDLGYRVIVLDNLSSGKRDYVDSRAIFIEGDILDESLLEEVFKTHKPGSVIHMAGLKAVGESEEQPARYFRNNVTGTLNVLSAASRHGTQRFIFSSTAGVYKEKDSGVYREEDALEGTSVYGVSKQMAEGLIEEFYRTGTIPAYTIFRYFNVAGDAGLGFREETPQNLIPRMLAKIASRKPVHVYGADYPTPDGSCVRDYIHVSDIVDAHVRSMQSDVSGIFNLGTNHGTSVLEMITSLEGVVGTTIEYEVHERRKGDMSVSLADAAKARNMLGWEASHSLEEILVSASKSFKRDI